MRNCNTCKYCWIDASVDDRECTCENLTEEEIEIYYADMKDGCPYYIEGESEIKVGYSF